MFECYKGRCEYLSDDEDTCMFDDKKCDIEQIPTTNIMTCHLDGKEFFLGCKLCEFYSVCTDT